MIALNRKSNEPLYTQIYNGIREKIISGDLTPDSKLTAVRVMAENLGVSKNTVELAYKQLLSEGFIRAEIGSGYYVEDVSSDEMYVDLKEWNINTNTHAEDIRYNFRYSSIETENFPWKKWKHYLVEAISDMEYQEYVSYEACKGNPELRANLKKFLTKNRGVKCHVEQLVVCSGTQHAAEIVAGILGGSGVNVAFEDPGFYTTRNIFKMSGCNVIPVPVTEKGIDIEELKQTDAKLVYVTPSRQMPMGYVMPQSQRQELLNWAEENDAYIFEDDYDNEFRYGESPMPSIQSMDKNGRVIYAGTFSKILLPSFRMAYFVLPQKLLKIFEKKYKHFNSFLPTSHQIATAKFLEDGSLERHMRRMVKLNQEKCEILMNSLKKYLGDTVEFFGKPGGTHIVVRFNNLVDDECLIKKLKDNSIRIYGIDSFFLNKKKRIPHLFMIGFNSINSGLIDEGCQEMSKIVKIVTK